MKSVLTAFLFLSVMLFGGHSLQACGEHTSETAVTATANKQCCAGAKANCCMNAKTAQTASANMHIVPVGMTEAAEVGKTCDNKSCNMISIAGALAIGMAFIFGGVALMGKMKI